MHVTVVCICTVRGCVNVWRVCIWFDLFYFEVFGCTKSSSTVLRESAHGCRVFNSKKAIIWRCNWVTFVLTVINNDKDDSLVESNPPLGQTSTPEATVLIQTTSSRDMPPQCPCASLGMPPFCCNRGKGGMVDEAVDDGHPDYTSSCGLFTVNTKQAGKQSIAQQQQKLYLLRMPAGFRFII